METIDYAIIAVCSAAIFAIFSAVIIAVFTYRASVRYKKEIINTTRFQISAQTVIDETIPELLMRIIDECFTDYQLMILAPRNEGYITEQREEEIRSDLVAKVSERISPIAIDKLSLRYNISNIDRVIGDKIYIVVTNYVVEHNDVKDKLEDVPKPNY